MISRQQRKIKYTQIKERICGVGAPKAYVVLSGQGHEELNVGASLFP